MIKCMSYLFKENTAHTSKFHLMILDHMLYIKILKNFATEFILLFCMPLVNNLHIQLVKR